MREILFRGKRTDNGEWVVGWLMPYINGGYEKPDEYPQLCIRNSSRSTGIHEVDPATVGQYTGLTDKNGVKIFEGDIIKALIRNIVKFRAVVKFRDGAFGLAYIRAGFEHFTAFTSICNTEFEIVGNVYDNTELLEG